MTSMHAVHSSKQNHYQTAVWNWDVKVQAPQWPESLSDL